ncbi:MAG: DNA polymerase III subunit gamma/tau [Gammaproteobacteria bacterium]|nr:DNA polymerase III subunit gamma/tau [Gammaproteobacteria bacterium]
MSYQVLARKWRPQTFTDMVGQEPTLRMLTNALTQKRLHHAYLFTGTRGVGKTTLARILSKCLNCETGITATPCETCPTCLSINAGQFLDLYEVDAASRTKVEDTRELLENVLYPPNQGRYKIYLIDEVHMLSNHSFNALLKTLEEPPAHVKFLLATTDPKKLPVTILSRCLQFHLKRILPQQIADYLLHVCQHEAIVSEPDALQHLALAAEGSMRDALSLLDQAIAYGQGQVNTADVTAMLGSVAQDDLLPLLEALSRQDASAVFAAANDLSERAPDFQQLIDGIISALHHIALAQVVPGHTLQAPSLQKLAGIFLPEDIQLYYQIALLGRRDLNISPHPHQAFEMTLIRLLAFKPQTSSTLVPERKATPQPLNMVSSKPTPIKTQSNIQVTAERQVEVPTANPETLPATPDEASAWRELLQKLELTGMAYALASNCTLCKITEKEVELALSTLHQPMLNTKLKTRIEEALSRHFKKPMQLGITITADEIATPVKEEKFERDQKIQQAKDEILQNPKIKQFIDMYDATLEVSLLT